MQRLASLTRQALRMRVVRLRLGDEHVELMQVLAPEGRPISWRM